jgi:signal transduction histidine kinase
MSIKRRLALLLGLLLLGFAITWAVVRSFARIELDEMVGGERRTRSLLLGHWIDVATRELPQFASDAAQSSEFARLIADSDPAARRRIESDLEANGFAALWIVGPDGAPRLEFFPRASSTTPRLPLSREELAQVISETPSPRFFVADGAHLLEVCVRRVQESATQDRLVVARRWDSERLRVIADLTEGKVSLTGPDDVASPPRHPTEIVLLRPLPDWRGHALRTLRVDYEAPEIGQAAHADWRQALLLVVYGVLLVFAVGLALQAWVLRPLRRIGESLARQDPELVRPLASDQTELGEIARLVARSFDQSAALHREIDERTRAVAALERAELALRSNIEERARLGRDLHDGVIQSLYAAGMGLAGMRDLLHADQTEAAARLEQTRAALNETIHDVRNFIIGLEPEALKLQTFSHAIGALLDALHGVRQFQSEVRIDENLAARLTLAQRVHALQITREAVSNALRHGNAGRISVGLRTVGEFAEFEITDDGRGFDPEASPGAGGLRNFAQRAGELGAQLTVESKPGQGTRVRLVFSFPPYA